MNSTSSDWNTKLHQSFDRLHPSIISSLSHTHTHDILVVIGFITVCLLLFLLIIQFSMKIRQIYRTSEPQERSKKSSRTQTKYPSYQKLLDTDTTHCSCLPKFPCVKSTCQILNPSPYYEKINERSMRRVLTPCNISCIRVHIVK